MDLLVFDQDAGQSRLDGAGASARFLIARVSCYHPIRVESHGIEQAQKS
jgi:hypothetical protein